jgi:hypothetical protein
MLNLIYYNLKDVKPILTTAAPGTCPDNDWLTYGSNCYKVEKIARSYAEAKFDCAYKGEKIIFIKLLDILF